MRECYPARWICLVAAESVRTCGRGYRTTQQMSKLGTNARCRRAPNPSAFRGQTGSKRRIVRMTRLSRKIHSRWRFDATTETARKPISCAPCRRAMSKGIIFTPVSLDADDPDTGGGDNHATRRGFAGFASCALCGLAEFAATEVSAQGTPPPAPAGFTRKMLSQMDGRCPAT